MSDPRCPFCGGTQLRPAGRDEYLCERCEETFVSEDE